MNHLRENPNSFFYLNDRDFYQNLISKVYNLLNASVKWSLDGKFLKINYSLFHKEYLRDVPIKCANLYDFINIMESCGFRCVIGPNEGERDVPIFARMEDCDRLVRPWEQFGMDYEYLYQNNNYEKNHSRRHPYGYKNGDFGQFENQYSYNPDPITPFINNSGPKYHQVVETNSLEKRNNPFPNHFTDYPIKMFGEKREYYSRKTSFTRTKTWQRKRKRNDDFKQFGNQRSFCHNKSAAFDDNRDHKIYEINSLGKRNNPCLRNFQNGSKRQYSRKTPSPCSRTFQEKQKRNGGFEQFGDMYSMYQSKNTGFDDNRGFKYHNTVETNSLGKRNSPLPRHLNNYLVDLPGKKRQKCSIKTPPPCSEDGQKNRREKNNDWESFGDNNNWKKFGDNKNCKTFSDNNNGKTFRDNNKWKTFGDNNNRKTFSDNNNWKTFGDNNNRKTFSDNNNWKTFGDNNNRKIFSDNNNWEYCHEAKTKPYRGRRRYFHSRIFNRRRTDVPGKELPSCYKNGQKRRRKLSHYSDKNVSDFTRCSIFKNADFLNQLMFYGGVDSDKVFIKDTSKDVMLCGDVVSDKYLIKMEYEMTDDDDIYICDCPSVVSETAM